mgnify:CR=1 FL=1
MNDPDITADSDEQTSASPVLMYDLVEQAICENATDIHIDPSRDGVLIRFRVDGLIRTADTLSSEKAQRLTNEIRVHSKIEIERIFRPHEGRFSYTSEHGRKDFRVTAVPVEDTVSLHIRLLTPPARFSDIERLGFAEQDMTKVIRALERPEGLILVCGPTGAGKSTTMYSMISQLDLSSMAAVSIEDPVEFRIPYMRQVEMDEDHGLTMYAGLRSLLRMDPDLIMISEIRDPESAVTSVRAAAAGRFVLATVHSRDSAAAVEALHYLSVPFTILGSSLRLIIAQNLVRRVCAECREERDIRSKEKKLFKKAGIDPPKKVPAARGCEACAQSGYSGRIGIFETVEVDEDLSSIITEGHDQIELRRIIRDRGSLTLIGDALSKVASGSTTVEEVMQIYWPGSKKERTLDISAWRE